VDFLMPRDAEIVKNNNPPLVANFAVAKAFGADLAIRFFQNVAIDGPMPQDGANISRISEFMTQRQGFHPRGGGPR
jgi:hypothetical protein